MICGTRVIIVCLALLCVGCMRGIVFNVGLCHYVSYWLSAAIIVLSIILQRDWQLPIFMFFITCRLGWFGVI